MAKGVSPKVQWRGKRVEIKRNASTGQFVFPKNSRKLPTPYKNVPRRDSGHPGRATAENMLARHEIEIAPQPAPAIRTERIRAVRGKYAFVPTSTEAFMQRKQAELEAEG